MRYERQIQLPEVGANGQQKLKNAKVLVVGAGGLGCPVLQNLVAAGIGTIGVVDGDLVEETNLHRQMLYGSEDCNKLKTSQAILQLKKQNPLVSFIEYPIFLDENNAYEIISDYDVVVDCTDEIAVRYVINDVCVLQKIPMVYGSIHRFEGQIAVFNYDNSASYRCLFPENKKTDAPNCSTMGVLGAVTSVIGSLQATEVLKIILNCGEVASDKIVVYDALQLNFQSFTFAKNPKQIETAIINAHKMVQNGKLSSSEVLNTEQFLQKNASKAVIYINLSQSFEELSSKIENIFVPLHLLEEKLHKFAKNQELVFFCANGIQSQTALHLAKSKGFTNVFHLKNGIKSMVSNQKK